MTQIPQISPQGKETISKIKNIIRDRPCIVISKGRSIERLELMINNLAKYDICWVGQNRVNYIEENILRKNQAV